MLQDQGVTIGFPHEALQFVVPKVAINDQTLLYILHVPYLDNTTSTLAKVYPLLINNQIISNYPDNVIIFGNTLFTSDKPEDFVQRQTYLREINDNCIATIIFGKHSECNSIFTNKTHQVLVSENMVLITNAKNQTLSSDCGPDSRTLQGNFVVQFSNCTASFSDHQFRSQQITTEATFIQRAYHNVMIDWKPLEHHNLKMILNATLQNRKKLEHVYLQRYDLSFKFWTLFGGFSFTTIATVIIIVIFCIRVKIFSFTKISSEKGLSELTEGVVRNDRSPDQLKSIATHTPNPELTSSSTIIPIDVAIQASIEDDTSHTKVSYHSGERPAQQLLRIFCSHDK